MAFHPPQRVMSESPARQRARMAQQQRASAGSPLPRPSSPLTPAPGERQTPPEEIASDVFDEGSPISSPRDPAGGAGSTGATDEELRLLLSSLGLSGEGDRDELLSRYRPPSSASFIVACPSQCHVTAF